MDGGSASPGVVFRDTLLSTTTSVPLVPGDSIGVECEYGVYEDGIQIHFAKIFGDLLAFSRIEAIQEDETRWRLPNGHLFYCDDWYAELATPPEPVSRRTPSTLAASVFSDSHWLVELLSNYSRHTGRQYSIKGVSTHLNISAGFALSDSSFVTRFALTFGPLFLFMTCLPDTLSVIFRPRPGRLEIVGEYIGDLPRLRASLTFLIGALKCTLESETSADRNVVPHLPQGSLIPSDLRYGWRLTVEAVSPELRNNQRTAKVPTENVGLVEMQGILDDSWQRMLPRLENILSRPEIRNALRYISGESQGGLELASPSDRFLSSVPAYLWEPAGDKVFRNSMVPRRVDGWEVSPVFVDWNFIVFAAFREAERIFVNIPRRYLAEFGAGRWDSLLGESLQSFSAVSQGGGEYVAILSQVDQTAEPGLFTSLDAPALAQQLERVGSKGKKKLRPPREPPADPVIIEVYRLGDYVARLKKHRPRPYYHERSLQTKQGAEILFHKAKGDFGHSFSASLAFPSEIKVQSLLTARVYLDPSFATWVDFTFPPGVVFTTPSTVEINVSVPDPETIVAVHIIRIYYDDLMKLKGQAVKVRCRYNRPGAAQTSATKGESPGTLPDSATRVNLLIYNRDLGNASIGQAHDQLDSDHSEHNAANGNVHIPVQVTVTHGHGYPASLDLHYNSLHSSYGAALRELSVYNNVPLDEIRKDYDSWLFGPGWTSSYDLRLFEYVVAEGPNNETLLERREFVCHDGNRIQFRKNAAGDYEPLFETDVFVGDPELALSFILKTEGQGFRLTDKHGNSFKFDGTGKIVEIGDLRTTRGNLKPLTVAYEPGLVSITDSVGRTTSLILSKNVVVSIEDPAKKKTTLSYFEIPDSLDGLGFPGDTICLLKSISDPISRTRTFVYDNQFFFLKSKVNRRSYEVTLTNYADAPPASVSMDVGQWFWGRLATFVDGDHAFAFKYLDAWPRTSPPAGPFTPSATDQPIEVVDPGRISTFYHLDLSRMAASDHWLAPKYGGELERLFIYEYRGKTKALLKSTDDWGGVTEFKYEPATPPGRGQNISFRSNPDDTSYTFTYTSDNRCETVRSKQGNLTKFGYDSMGNQTSIEQPETLVAVDPDNDELKKPITTIHYDDQSRIEWQTDPRGLKTSYVYGGPNDPGPSGQATEEHREIAIGGPTEDEIFEYTLTGEIRRHKNKTTGLILVSEYDDSHRHIGDFTSGIEVMGAPGIHHVSFGLNENDHVETNADSLGRNETVTYDRFDLELRRVTRTGAAIETIERDGRGNATKVRDLTGFVKQYDYDERDRLLSITFPLPLAGNEQHATFTRDYNAKARKTIERQGNRTVTYVQDKAGRILETTFEDSAGELGKIVNKYLAGDAPHSVERRSGTRTLQKITYDRDYFGRITEIEQIVSGSSSTTKIVYDAGGNIARIKPPRFDASPAKDPSIYMEYDGLNRRLTTRDSYGRIVEKTDYDDVAQTFKVFRQDPSLDSTDYSSDALVLVTNARMDGWGKIAEETTHGQTAKYLMDSAGRMVQLVGADKRPRLIKTYTPMDNVETVTVLKSIFSANAGGVITVDRGSAVSTYRYDAMGNLVFVQQPGRPATTYAYDEMGRRVEERRGGAFLFAVSYDSLGRVKTLRDASAGTRSFVYDENARKLTVTYTHGGSTDVHSYAMDESGWLKSLESSVSDISVSYDRAGDGRLVLASYSLRGAPLGSVKYTYDEAGNRDTKEFRFGGASELTRHRFDANMRLRKLTTYQVEDIAFKYNSAGLLRVIERGQVDSDKTEFFYNAAAELQEEFHRVSGSPIARYHDVVEQFDAELHPQISRALFLLRSKPQQVHRRNTRNVYTSDGTHFQEITEDTVEQQGITTRITNETALNLAGDPFLARETTEIVAHPDQLMRGKTSVTETSYAYAPDGKLDSLQRTVGDFDGTTLETNSMTMKYDVMRRLASKRVVQNDLKRGKTLTNEFTFSYDAFFRLASVEVKQEFNGTATNLKTSRFSYGADNQLLGETREYHDADLQTFIASNDYLKSRPNPIYYLHDGDTPEVEMSASGGRYFYNIVAPGGSYPLGAVGPDGAVYMPHQDLNGTTVLFSDGQGAYHSYLPFHQGEVPDQAAHSAVQGGHHRLGDGAPYETWAYWLTQPIMPVTQFGDHLPFSLIPIESPDLASYADSEIGLYGHHLITQKTISERAWNVIKKLLYLTPPGMFFLMVESAYDTIQRRFLEFQDLGFSTFEASVEAVVAGVGDYVGYTDLLEGCVGVDLTTSTGLEAKERWKRGIWGAVSIILSFVGYGLKGVSAIKLLAPATKAQRLLRGVHIAYKAWQVGSHVWNRVQLATEIAQLIRHDILHPDDPELHLADNGPSIFKWAFRAGGKIAKKVGLNKTTLAGTSSKQAIFIKTLQRLYDEGLDHYKNLPAGGTHGQGGKADRYVRVKLRLALRAIRRGDTIVEGSVAHALQEAGVLREHLHFGGPGMELGPDSKVNIDILWTKGKVAIEFKRSIKSLTSPGRGPQHRTFLSYFKGRRYWFGYIGQDETGP